MSSPTPAFPAFPGRSRRSSAASGLQRWAKPDGFRALRQPPWQYWKPTFDFHSALRSGRFAKQSQFVFHVEQGGVESFSSRAKKEKRHARATSNVCLCRSAFHGITQRPSQHWKSTLGPSKPSVNLHV